MPVPWTRASPDHLQIDIPGPWVPETRIWTANCFNRTWKTTNNKSFVFLSGIIFVFNSTWYQTDRFVVSEFVLVTIEVEYLQLNRMKFVFQTSSTLISTFCFRYSTEHRQWHRNGIPYTTGDGTIKTPFSPCASFKLRLTYTMHVHFVLRHIPSTSYPGLSVITKTAWSFSNFQRRYFYLR